MPARRGLNMRNQDGKGGHSANRVSVTSVLWVATGFADAEFGRDDESAAFAETAARVRSLFSASPTGQCVRRQLRYLASPPAFAGPSSARPRSADRQRHANGEGLRRVRVEKWFAAVWRGSHNMNWRRRWLGLRGDTMNHILSTNMGKPVACTDNQIPSRPISSRFRVETSNARCHAR